jgi:hypothetical protein
MIRHKTLLLLIALWPALVFVAGCSASPVTPTLVGPTPTLPAPFPPLTPSATLPSATDSPVSQTITAASTETATLPPTSTATLTSTPSPTDTLAPTQLLFTDDFSGTCDLPSGQDANGEWGCQNGEYVITNRTAGYAYWSYYPTLDLNNLIFEADARPAPEVPNVSYGLIFRVVHNDFYGFELDKDGQLYIFHHPVSGKASTIYSSKLTANAVKPDQNHLKIVVQDEQAAIYVNGTWINTVNGIATGSGSVGFSEYSAFASGTAAFSNVSVTRINIAGQLPAPLPTESTAQASPTQQAAQPTATSKYELPPGKGGLVVRNYYGGQADFTISNQTHTLPPGGADVFIILDPGHYTWSSHLPGVGTARGTVDIVAGQIQLLTFASH